MKVRHIIMRYFSIMGRLSGGKRASYEKIKSYLEHQMFQDDSSEKLQFSKRTLQREIVEIEALFQVEIKCDHEGQYYIAENNMRQEVERFSNNFLLINFQKYFENFEKHIVFDHSNVKGTEYLSDIQFAIKNRNSLLIKYFKYSDTKGEIQNRNVAPFGLKEYKGRWYLLSKDLDINEFRTFGLDRIKELVLTTQRFLLPNDFDITTYFKETIGVTLDRDKPIEIVELKTNKLLGNYIKNLPLHTSQTIVKETENETSFRLKLQINDELVNELMLYSDELTILKPPLLIKKMKYRAEQILKNHPSEIVN